MREILHSTGKPPPLYPIFEHLTNFIDDVLCDFKPQSTNKKGDVVNSEDGITQDLVRYLNDKQEFSKQKIEYPFNFENQTKQDSKRVDIGVRFGRRYTAINNALICWIEAKRLPTPNKNKDRDDREYVIVDKKKFNGNGGVQRFKEGEYAPDLDYSIMIGYMQENDTNHWLSKINGWITDLADTDNGFWTNEDCLSKYDSNKCDRFLSIHKRKDIEKPITLHHYWIKL